MFYGSFSTIGQQASHVRAWMATRLWAQVFTGLVLGVLAGLYLSGEVGLVPRETAASIGQWLALPGKLFLNLIAMVLVPVVVVSIIQGITAAKGGGELRRVGTVFGTIVVASTLAAAALGVALADLIRPGAFITGFEAPDVIRTAVATATERRLPDIIAGLVPTDIQRVLAERDMTAIVILSVMVGVACRQASRERIQPFLRGLEGLLEVAMTIVKWAMFLTPFAVFGLVAQMVAEVGVSTIFGMSVYVLTVIGGLVAVLALYLLLVMLAGGISVGSFLRAIAGVQLLAFSTSSSAAVMPLSIDTATKKLHVPSTLADVVIPLGATMNMAGTALYQAVAVLFLAQMTGVDLTTSQVIGVVGTLVVSSIGAPGTPGVSVAILTSVAAGLGIPGEGMVLILGVDRILDMFRTVVNVTGDLSATVVLNRLQAAPAVSPGA